MFCECHNILVRYGKSVALDVEHLAIPAGRITAIVGRRAQLVTRIDQSLIGGMRIRVGDTVMIEKAGEIIDSSSLRFKKGQFFDEGEKAK